MENSNSFLSFAAPAAASFNQLSAGCYNAVCCGVTIKEMPNYARTATEHKIFIIFQILDDDGTLHYVRTKPLRNVNNEKSALVETIGGWLRKSSADLSGLQFTTLIGTAAQCVIVDEEKNGKRYVRLSQVLPAKANADTAIVADAKVPSFITADTVFAQLADGLAVRQQAQPIASTTPQPFNPISANVVNHGNDGLPF